MPYREQPENEEHEIAVRNQYARSQIPPACVRRPRHHTLLERSSGFCLMQRLEMCDVLLPVNRADLRRNRSRGGRAQCDHQESASGEFADQKESYSPYRVIDQDREPEKHLHEYSEYSERRHSPQVQWHYPEPADFGPLHQYREPRAEQKRERRPRLRFGEHPHEPSDNIFGA